MWTIEYPREGDVGPLTLELLRRLPTEGGACLLKQFPTKSNDALLALGRGLGNLSADASLPNHPLEDGFVFRVEALAAPCQDEAGGTILSTSSDDFFPHTDGTGRAAPYTFVMLLCVSPAKDGGDSFLFEATDAIARLPPADVEILRSPIFSWGGTSRHAIIEGETEPWNIRYNRNGLVVVADDHRKECARSALGRLATVLQNLALESRFRLDAGDCLVFDNRRVLHGRTAFGGNGRLLKRLRTV